MLRDSQFSTPSGVRHHFEWLGGQRRWVRARIVIAGEEADSFDASSATSLDLTLNPALIYLPLIDAHVEYAGVTSTWGPLGLGRRNYVTFLSSRAQADAFLGDGGARPSRRVRSSERTRAAERRRGHATTGEASSAQPWSRTERELLRGDRSRMSSN